MTELVNYLQSAQKIIDLRREQNLQLKSDLEKEVSKREKAVEGNTALKKLLHAVMGRYVPDPRAFICHYFID